MQEAMFQESPAWLKAMDMIDAIYAATRSFPKEELFGLTNQVRRASVSVASNIAEGHGRLTQNELLHFLGMARGSVFEVQTQLQIARRQCYGNPDEIKTAERFTIEAMLLLNARIGGLRARIAANKQKS